MSTEKGYTPRCGKQVVGTPGTAELVVLRDSDKDNKVSITKTLMLQADINNVQVIAVGDSTVIAVNVGGSLDTAIGVQLTAGETVTFLNVHVDSVYFDGSHTNDCILWTLID